MVQTILINNDYVDHITSKLDVNLLLLNLRRKLTQFNVNVDFLVCICMSILLNEFLFCIWIFCFLDSFDDGFSNLLCWLFWVIFWHWKRNTTMNQTLCGILLRIIGAKIFLLFVSVIIGVTSFFDRILVGILIQIRFWTWINLIIIRLITVWLYSWWHVFIFLPNCFLSCRFLFFYYLICICLCTIMYLFLSDFFRAHLYLINFICNYKTRRKRRRIE